MKAMDSGRWLRASGHLDRVLELPPHERDACLADIRRHDPEVATDVAAMLEQHRRLSAEGFLDAAPVTPVEASLAGVTIGAYTLISKIGHGGMGSVWLATRSDGHFEGKAAVKLLNAALVGRGGEERFRREGTILARLAHPHIARLIDAGVSATGQPYLVLELIDGRHLDVYCDEEQLDLPARIRLFLDVQSAVSHAHANLIVHRDLKPSNVLVTRDGQVKLLDFSIAKLIEDDTGQGHQSPLTRESGSALTPKYAAPEQVNGGVITTATDVYALGVLLYELLTGRHPAGDLPKSPAEFARAVTEDEPQPMPEALKGDLETILGKALKKNPEERYASVAEFADDLRRHLEHQPIKARPDTVGYRTAKFARRHWRPVGAIAAVALVLAGLGGYHAMRLAAERDRARIEAEKASRVSELLTSVLTSVDPYRTPDAREPSVQNLLDAGVDRVRAELGDQPELQAELLTVIGRTFDRMGVHAKALPLLEEALAIGRRTFAGDHPRVAQSLNDLGVLRRQLGQSAEAEPLLRESLAMRRRVLGPGDKDVAVTLVELSRALRDLGRLEESEAPAREALAIRQAVFGDEHRETATSKSDLASVLWDRGDLATAERLYRESAVTTERLLGPDHPNTGAAKRSLGLLLMTRGSLDEAEALLSAAAEVNRKVFGDAHTQYAFALNAVASVRELQGRNEEALALFERALAISQPALGADHRDIVTIMLNIARLQIALGRPAPAAPALRHVLAVRERQYVSGDWRIGQAQSLLGAALAGLGRFDEAEPLMRAADQSLKDIPGRQARERAANRARLAALSRTAVRTPRADRR